MTRALGLAALLFAASAQAVPFSITISNTAPSGTPGWSTGLLTLSPLIATGLSPQPGNPDYFTYAFANSNCDIAGGCTGTGCDNGNATLLATRRGLTLGVNAWTVPALAVGAQTTVNIDVPVGSRLSYIAWVNSTAVFDDFVALNEVGSPAVLSAPLFDASGNALANVVWEVRGYDVNSTSPTDGSGPTCTNQCPASQSGVSCYVTVGNATYGATGTIGAQLPGVISKLTALSGNVSNRLTWTNPAPAWGVVVLRRINQSVASVPTGAATVGTTYGNGNASNRSVVVYNGTGTNTILDTYNTGTHPLSNGSRYYYKVFARNSANQYANGDVPSSQGLFSIPTPGTLPNPRWCYSWGVATAMQPVIALGSGVYLGSNSGGITANNPDGSERFRPVQLPGAIQGRFLALPRQGFSGTFLIATDQSGNVTMVDGTTGNRVWTRALATTLQAQPSMQHYSVSDTNFRNLNPNRDLIYVASRNSSGANTVTALSSVDGTTAWQYSSTTMGLGVSGGMLLDRTNNRLWVASRGAPSIRVLSTLDGTLLRSYSVGDIDLPVSWGYTAGEAIVTLTTGEVRAYSLGTMNFTWRNTPGTQNAYAFPTGNGYIGSLAAGQVQRYLTQSDGGVSAMWSPVPAIASPTGVRIDYNTDKVVVGNTAGVMSQLNVTTGAIERNITVQSGIPIGTTNVDTNINRLYVPVADGRMCAYDVPF